MVPYVRKSFYKHYKEGVKYLENLEWSDSNMPDSCENLSIDSDFYKESYTQKVYQYAMDMTIKETNQAVEGMYHNLNTLQSRSGNQLKRMAG
jgi:ribonucleoside-triphosphate reductase